MKQPAETVSPPLQAPRIKIGAGAVRVILLAVVAAAIGYLVWYAQYVPAITTELGGWLLDHPTTAVDTPEGRRSQVIFLLMVYSAPLALGATVYVVNYLIAGLKRWSKG